MFVGYLAAYLVPLAIADTSKTMPRIPYALRVIGSLAALLATGFVAGITMGEAGSLVAMAVCCVMVVFMVLWSAHRAQDIGWSKWSCLLYLVPLVGLIFWLLLFFWPGQGESGRATVAAA